MANEHPFQMLFETLGRLPVAHAEMVNRDAYRSLCDILSVPVDKTGRCILLRAPRAGHGKTHLLSRIQFHLGASHEFIPLHAAFGCRIDATSVTDDVLRRLLRPLPASGGLCVLDLVSRRLFAMALQPLVGSGEVPCQDREGALMALRTRPIETFDFHHPNAVTAHWARENFEILGQRLSMEIAQRGGLTVREVAFWVETLFRFAATPLDQPVRLRLLADAIHQGNPSDGLQMDRLEALLGMLALLMRVVLVADDLEGFSSDESAALGFAAFLGSLRHSVERLDVILSLNQDVWDSAFVPRLSGGLADRLSEVVVELGPLTEPEMIALLESRLPGLGSRVLERLDRSSAGTHARGVIREAGMAWLRASSGDVPSSSPSEAPVAVPVVIPPDFVAEMVSKPIVIAPETSIPFSETEPENAVRSFAEPEIAPPLVAQETLGESAGLSGGLSEIIGDSENTVAWPAPEFAPIELDGDLSFVNMGDAEISPFSIQSSDIEDVPASPNVETDAPTERSLVPPDVSVPSVSQITLEPVNTPIFQATPEPAAPPVFQATPEPAAPPVFQATPEPAAPPVFQATPEPAAPPVFQATPEPAAPPVFQATPEPAAPPVFQTTPESSAPSVFQVAPEAPVPSVSHGVGVDPVGSAPELDREHAPPQPKVPDTDRVDDLLRQFRERYGRGSQ